MAHNSGIEWGICPILQLNCGPTMGIRQVWKWFLWWVFVYILFFKGISDKEIFSKNFKFFPLGPPYGYEMEMKKNLKIFFLQFHSRYQNVHIRQNQCWFQNFPNLTGWATIRLQNRAQGTPAMCPILWLNCGPTSWARKVLKTPLFMIYVYILILGIVFQFGDDDFETFLRGTP